MAENILKIIIVFIVGTVGGIFADQILWPYLIERPLFYQYRLDQPPVYLTETKEIVIQENTALTEAIKKAKKVVLGIKSENKKGKILEGSCLLLTSDGLAITLASLAPSKSDVNIYLDEKEISFQVLKRDLDKNLVLIKIEGKNLPTNSFANLEKAKLGERVFLLGKTANQGIIRSFNNGLIETNIQEEKSVAGSGLFNIEGEILGINTINKQGRVIAITIKEIKEFAAL